MITQIQLKLVPIILNNRIDQRAALVDCHKPGCDSRRMNLAMVPAWLWKTQTRFSESLERDLTQPVKSRQIAVHLIGV